MPKRPTIYLTDEEYQHLKDKAGGKVSTAIRQLVQDDMAEHLEEETPA